MRVSIAVILIFAVSLVSCSRSAQPASPPAVPKLTTPPPTTNAAPDGADLDQAGVPVYPGATIGGDVKNDGNPAQERFVAMLTTTDSTDRVVDFYTKALNLKSKAVNGVIHIDGKTAKGADILMSIGPEGPTTKITIQGILYKNSKGSS